MTDEFPDVHKKVLRNSFKLNRVGIRNVRKPVTVNRPNKTVTLIPTIDIFVDLPSTLRGSHMSRNIEVVNEVLDNIVREPVASIEDLSEIIATRLLDRHEYATTAEVHMRADYFMDKQTFSGTPCLENYVLLAESRATRGEGVVKRIGVEAIGMTACPCAQETILKVHEDDGHDVPQEVPGVSHNQRNVATLVMDVPDGADVDADILIEILEGAFSAPTREVLKRKDEAAIIVHAHKNPKFVEDVVRDVLRTVLERFPELPDDVRITVQSESEESIHKHDAFAERRTTVGELKR